MTGSACTGRHRKKENSNGDFSPLLFFV